MYNDFIVKESGLDGILRPRVPNDKVVLLSGRVRSGKTTCLAFKLLQLREMTPEAAILWITPNSLYSSFINSELEAIGLSCRLATINEFLKNGEIRADYAIVDEASFLTENQLLRIASATKKTLFLSVTEGDVAPAFYIKNGEKGIDAETISTHFGITPYCLFLTHLNNGTKRLISKLYEERSIVTECIVDNHLHNCKYKELVSEEPVEDFVENYITRCAGNNTGILYFTNEDVYMSYQRFSELNFMVECKYNCASDWKNNINFSSPSPKLLTIHSCAGISFDTVFIILNERVVQNIGTSRDLLAYALTRGHNEVVIVSKYKLPAIITDNATPICNNISVL